MYKDPTNTQNNQDKTFTTETQKKCSICPDSQYSGFYKDEKRVSHRRQTISSRDLIFYKLLTEPCHANTGLKMFFFGIAKEESVSISSAMSVLLV